MGNQGGNGSVWQMTHAGQTSPAMTHGAVMGHQEAPELCRSNANLPPDWADKVTVMMRNLPNKYTQKMLVSEINESGFLGTFDFLYLPIDPETNANRGYAFINFTEPNFAWMFKMTFEGRKMSRFNSTKVVSVSPATLQGFEANYSHYSSARVSRGSPAARPLFLRTPSEMPQGQRGGPNGPNSGRGARGRRRGGAPAPTPGKLSLLDAHAAAVGGGPSQGASAKDEAKFCPFCGGAILSHYQFCTYCGGSLEFRKSAGPNGGGDMMANSYGMDGGFNGQTIQVPVYCGA